MPQSFKTQNIEIQILLQRKVKRFANFAKLQPGRKTKQGQKEIFLLYAICIFSNKMVTVSFDTFLKVSSPTLLC